MVFVPELRPWALDDDSDPEISSDLENTQELSFLAFLVFLGIRDECHQ